MRALLPRPARTGVLRRLGCASLLAVALAVAGCGGTGDDQAVKRTMQRFLAAVGRGDGRTACALLTPSGQAALATLASQIAPALTSAPHTASCQLILTAIGSRLKPATKQGLESAQVQKVTVKGNTASVLSSDIRATKGNLSSFLAGSAPTKLVKVGGTWKVTS